MADNENNEAEVNGEGEAAVNGEGVDNVEPKQDADKPPEEGAGGGEIPDMAKVTPLSQDLSPPREQRFSNVQFEQLKSDTMAVNKTLKQLESSLSKQLEAMYAASRRRLYLSSAMMLFFSALLSWTWLNLHTAFRPENLANATANIVIDAIPNATDHLHILLIDGAPDIAETFSEHLTQNVPVFRELLAQEFQETVEELSNALAAQTVETALSMPVTEEAETTMSMIIRLDAALEEMYNSPIGDSPVTMRDDLLHHMSRMTATNDLLEELSEGGTPVLPEDLLIGWLNIVSLATQ